MNVGIVLLSLQVITSWCSEPAPEAEVKSERSEQLVQFTKHKTDLFENGVPKSPVTPLVTTPPDTDEEDKKIAAATEEVEVSEEESSLFWQLYGMAIESHKDHKKLDERLWNQIYSAIKDNLKVLQSTRSIRSRYWGRNDYQPTLPLCAFAQFLGGLGSWWDHEHPETYVDAFFHMVELDTNNDRRLKALAVLIENRVNKEHIEKLKEKVGDASTSPHLILTVLAGCYVEKTISGLSWTEKIKNYLSGRTKEDPKTKGDYVEVPQSDRASFSKVHEFPKKVFKFNTIHGDLQLRKLEAARIFVGKRASLEAINPDFPPQDHALKCASCQYLRTEAAKLKK